jgi:hypothetical protein
MAQAVVEQLKTETETHPEESNKRIHAARERAARERRPQAAPSESLGKGLDAEALEAEKL